MRLLNAVGRIAGVLLVAAAVGVTAAAASGVAWPTRGWQAGTAAGAGLDAGTLDTLDRDLAAGKYGIVDSIQAVSYTHLERTRTRPR